MPAFGFSTTTAAEQDEARMAAQRQYMTPEFTKWYAEQHGPWAPSDLKMMSPQKLAGEYAAYQATLRSPTPAEAAQEMAEQERMAALNLLSGYRDEVRGMGQPGDINTDYLVNRELERNAAAAARERNVARDVYGASGLGRSGGLNTMDRLIREQMTRRNISGERDVRTGVASQRMDLLGPATGSLANVHLGTSWQLPQSGIGQPLQRPYNDYSWLYGTQPKSPLTTVGG
jgi:hypothetical protein